MDEEKLETVSDETQEEVEETVKKEEIDDKETVADGAEKEDLEDLKEDEVPTSDEVADADA